MKLWFLFSIDRENSPENVLKFLICFLKNISKKARDDICNWDEKKIGIEGWKERKEENAERIRLPSYPNCRHWKVLNGLAHCLATNDAMNDYCQFNSVGHSLTTQQISWPTRIFRFSQTSFQLLKLILWRHRFEMFSIFCPHLHFFFCFSVSFTSALMSMPVANVVFKTKHIICSIELLYTTLRFQRRNHISAFVTVVKTS